VAVPNYSLLFGLAALGLLVGCQQTPVPQRPAEAPPAAPAAMARSEADQLMERGDYARAAARYQEAVAFEPDDMALRFALGTAYSHLGRRAEAAEQFQWAVKRGDPEAEYYRSARQWLVSAGLLSDGRSVAAAVETPVKSQEQASSKGKVAGSLEWPGVNPRERLIKVRVTLTGEEDATKSVNLSRPFRLGERFEFLDLVPGKYRVVAKAEDGAPALDLWDQPVTVEAGKVTTLPLSASNSKQKPDQFPGPAVK
jgi:tetratricopeptide (TPR) repeat protein